MHKTTLHNTFVRCLSCHTSAMIGMLAYRAHRWPIGCIFENVLSHERPLNKSSPRAKPTFGTCSKGRDRSDICQLIQMGTNNIVHSTHLTHGPCCIAGAFLTAWVTRRVCCIAASFRRKGPTKLRTLPASKLKRSAATVLT